MTVAQLIEKLKEMPENAVVCKHVEVEADMDFLFEVTEVNEDDDACYYDSGKFYERDKIIILK